MKVNVLRSKMALKELNQNSLAKLLGVSRNTMSSRMSGHSSFTLDEVDRLCEILEIREDEEKQYIFLT